MSQRQFIWTDDLVARFVTWSLTESPTFQGRYADIEQFKKMHSKFSVEDVLKQRDAQPFEYKGSLTRPLTPNEAYPPAAEPKGKEWEIVAINHKGEVYTEESMIFRTQFKTNLPFNIHSVRRLSDNEVFAVGQKVFNREGEGVDWGERQSTIIGFSLMDYGCGMFVKLYSDGETSPSGDFVRELCDIKAAPARTPLFTTTDGKPMFAGETVYVVPPNKENVQFVFNPGKAFMNMYRTYKWFSTQAAAEQWIADNKPLYSLNDIQKALHGEWGTQNAVDNVLNRIKNSKK